MLVESVVSSSEDCDLLESILLVQSVVSSSKDYDLPGSIQLMVTITWLWSVEYRFDNGFHLFQTDRVI